jgi:hypothetical protein
MMFLRGQVPVFLLILVMMLGAWTRPVSAAPASSGEICSTSEDAESTAEWFDSETEDSSPGEENEGESESETEAKLLALVGRVVLGWAVSDPSTWVLSCELPLHGRDMSRELFRPPRQ